MSSEIGLKYDSGKPKLGMVLGYFSKAITAVAECGTYGQQKYAPDEYWDFNWNKVPNGIKRYTDAQIRHLLAESDGMWDEESKLLHAAHVAWNALARLELIIEDLEEGGDGSSN